MAVDDTHSVNNSDESSSSRISSRRHFLLASGATASGIVSLAGCIGSGGEGNGSSQNSSGTKAGSGKNQNEFADELTVFTWGGSWGDAINDIWLQPFGEENGVTINHETFGDAFQMIAKIRSGGADLDLIDHSNPTVYPGVKDDIWAPLRLNNIPHTDRLLKRFSPDNIEFDPGKRLHSMPLVFGANGPVYNYEHIDEPTNWSNLFTDETKGKVSLSQFPDDVVGTAALSLGYNLQDVVKNYNDVIEEIWDQVNYQNNYMVQWWDSGATMNQLLTTGAAWTGSQWYGRIVNLRKENNVSVRYTLPEEGAVGWVDTWSIPTTIEDPKRYTAERLIDYTLQEGPSTQMAKNGLPYAQPVKFDTVPKVIQNNPDYQNPDKIQLWNPEFLAKHKSEWERKFQTVIRR